MPSVTIPGTTGHDTGIIGHDQRNSHDLARKEKALSEAAALLILQKKFRALWENEAK